MTRQFLTKKIKTCNMRFVNLEETFKYLKIQEILRLENLTEYYLCKGMFFSTLTDIIQAQSKTNR